MSETKGPIKEAFSKVKEDISSLKSQLNELSSQISALKSSLNSQSNSQTVKQAHNQADKLSLQAEDQTSQAHSVSISQKQPLYSLKTQNFKVSTGNDGVQAVRQTDRQSGRQTDTSSQKFAQSIYPSFQLQPEELTRNFQSSPTISAQNQDKLSQISRVSEVVNSLDSLKKDLRKQFKRLTPQEMLIFSTIYQLTDEGFSVDYSLLSSKAGLSESAVRDYIHKLLKKGIPLEKSKEDNTKRIFISIPQEFKRIASLQTIISLREL